MNRLSLRCWLTSLLLGPTCALALEVGEIQVQSALNQLFDATIPLPTLTPEDLSRVSVKIASPPMFEEFGLDRTPTLTHLVFSIQYDAEGRVYVKVVSTQPIREPSLALLLEFGWPRGKTFREFTVLLDPVRRLTQRPGSRTKTVLNTPEMSAAVPSPTPVAEAPRPTAASAPTPAYKPGDFYGPVAPGEGLWGIALKLRPEGITREQMMQALFQANPQAFSSAGISGLKTGAKLRLPTYREIADSTGSPIAQRLAVLENPPAAPVIADNTPPPKAPEVFPLAPSAIPEPTVVTETPASKPAEPEKPAAPVEKPVEPQKPAVPDEKSVEPEKPAAPDEKSVEPEKPAESLPAESEKPVEPEKPAAPAEKPVESSEPAKPTEPQQPAESPQSAQSIAAAPTSDSPVMEPVSATPLLFIVVSEILMDATKLPTVAPSEPAASKTPIAVADKKPAEPEKPEESTTQPPAESSAVPDEKPAESPVPVVTEEKPAESPTPVAEEKPAEPPAPVADEKPDKVYKGGEEYGPVSNNERLWDIATKVRPDSNLGRDIMMKALFMANPQAFSKPTMDHLKVGSTLRIPTLEEIVKHTDSPVARNLLEQQQAAKSGNADLPKSTSPGEEEEGKIQN